MYQRSLKENVKDKLIRASIKIESLDDLIRITIEIDDNLYERTIEKHYDVTPRGKSRYVLYCSNNKGQNNFSNRNN